MEIKRLIMFLDLRNSALIKGLLVNVKPSIVPSHLTMKISLSSPPPSPSLNNSSYLVPLESLDTAIEGSVCLPPWPCHITGRSCAV